MDSFVSCCDDVYGLWANRETRRDWTGCGQGYYVLRLKVIKPSDEQVLTIAFVTLCTIITITTLHYDFKLYSEPKEPSIHS